VKRQHHTTKPKKGGGGKKKGDGEVPAGQPFEGQKEMQGND